MSVITVKTPGEIEMMRRAGRVTAGARTIARQALHAGVTTAEIDREVNRFIVKNGAIPTFLGYGGFPGSACVSVNEEVIHGIPGRRAVKEGDIVSLDVGATLDGWVGDCAGTFPCGEVSAEAARLISVTRQSFFEGIKYARAGRRLGDVGAAIEDFVVANGYTVIRDYVGHGIGREMHEAPEVPNFGRRGHGPRLVPGMTLAVEPMVSAGAWQVRVLGNKWTVVTADSSLSAHYENTILITDGEAEILTMADDL